MKVVVHPVERSAGTALLTVDWSVGADSPRPDPLYVSLLMRSPGTASNLGELRLVDLESGWVAWPMTDDGTITTTSQVPVSPGETVTSEAVFAPPPGESVDLMLPDRGFVDGIPVVEAEAAAPPEVLGSASGDSLRSAELESYSAAFDDSSTASVEGEETTVALASDVLFTTDEYELTPEAVSRVDEVAERIRDVAQEGEVAGVGHTDDVGSEAYNRELSVNRAESVAARLGPALGSGFTVTTEGRGKTEPVAEGTSREARAVNRRVEIRFAAVTAGAPVGVSSAPVPEADGVVGVGHETVEVEHDEQRYEVSVRRVEARSGYLIGTIEVTRLSSAGEVRIPFVPTRLGPQHSRGFGAVTQVAGATSVRLVGEGSWVYPVDCKVRDSGEGSQARSVLADRLVSEPFNEQGQVVVATVVWPDTGHDAVTVDVAGRFWIADVPVEGRS